MNKVLIVKSNPNGDEVSKTAKLTASFIKEYKALNPEDQIDVYDTYEQNAQPLTSEEINLMFSGQENRIKDEAVKFASYDKIVIAAPMWNLSIPASLKCYIDYISYVGVSFKYTETGPVGLLENKKALFLTSRGGMYKSGPAQSFEMGELYLRTIFGFFGITDFQSVALENTNVLTPEQLAEEQVTVEKEIKEIVANF